MSTTTSIEWTDRTWNPVTGCTKVSAGCDHCYAETLHERFNGKGSFATVTVHPDRITAPLSWRKPARVFVNSMSDLFHADITDDVIASIWATMSLAQEHTFQVLTKRHARMRSLLNSDRFWARVDAALRARGGAYPLDLLGKALPNVWLGVSVEDQSWASIRIPALLETPAAVRWISAEPLLGPLWLEEPYLNPGLECPCETGARFCNSTLDWVVVGGESGPGARPMDPAWARQIRDDCTANSVPFLFKQWGAHDATGKRVGKKAAGRELDGRTYDAYPDVTA
jgi:protein gp37